jgi:hypothetical protein
MLVLARVLNALEAQAEAEAAEVKGQDIKTA